MKILFNTYPLAFDVPGGGEIQLLETKAALERLGEKVELFDMWNPQVRTTDVVHHFTSHAGSDIFINHVKAVGKPLAASPIIYPHKNPDQYPLLAINHLLVMADIVFPNSQAEADLLVKVFPAVKAEKMHVVYNGVDHSFMQDPDYDDLLFREVCDVSSPYVLCVANIEARKNQIRLAQALQGSGLTLVLVGNVRDGAYFEEVKKAAGGNFRYLGYLSHESEVLRSAYLGCEVFALPSTLETPGLAALEAGALGARVVITEVGAPREYFGPYAQFVNPDDVDSIREGIKRSLAIPKDGRLKAHIRSNFTWENTARQTLAGYRKIVKA